MEYLYTLQLQDGKYYVGKSSDPDARYLQHKNGTGAAWTKKYKPVKLLDTKLITSEYDETNLTKDFIKKYGIENVRGGPYTQLELDKTTKDVLEREFLSESNKCYNCGNSGHFIKQCPSKVQNKEESIFKKKIQNQDLLDGNTNLKSLKTKKMNLKKDVKDLKMKKMNLKKNVKDLQKTKMDLKKDLMMILLTEKNLKNNRKMMMNMIK